MNKPTPASIQDIPSTKKVIQQIISSLSFFSDILEKAGKEDVDTHLGLLESYTQELAELTGYASEKSKRIQKRNQMLQQANATIHQLKQEMGKTMSAHAIESGLKHYEDVFRCWYESLGFHYASISYSPYRIVAELSEEIDLEMIDEDGHLCSDKTLFRMLCKQHAGYRGRLQTVGDAFHQELIDQESNRCLIEELLVTAFPNCIIDQMISRRGSFQKRTLRIRACISLQDLQQYEDKIRTQIEREENQ